MKIKILCTLIATLLYFFNGLYADIKAPKQSTTASTIITRAGLSRRQLAQYDFLQRHLEPDILEESQVIKQLRIWFKTGVIYGATAAISYAIAWLLWQLPFIQEDIQNLNYAVNESKWRLRVAEYAQGRAERVNEYFRKWNPQRHANSPTEKDMQRITNAVKESEQALTEFNTFFWTMQSLLFAVLRPFVRDIVDDYLPDNPFSYAQILTEFVKHWHEYKVCTPKEFHYEFDILRLCAQITDNKLAIDENIAELIITGIVMQIIDTTVNNEASD